MCVYAVTREAIVHGQVITVSPTHNRNKLPAYTFSVKVPSGVWYFTYTISLALSCLGIRISTLTHLKEQSDVLRSVYLPTRCVELQCYDSRFKLAVLFLGTAAIMVPPDI